MSTTRSRLESALRDAEEQPQVEPARKLVDECHDLIASLRKKGVPWKRIGALINESRADDRKIAVATIKTYFFIKNAGHAKAPLATDNTKPASEGESVRTKVKRTGFESLVG